MTRFIAAAVALTSVLTWTLAAQAQDASASEETQALVFVISYGVTLPLLTTSSTSDFATESNKENLREEIEHYENIVRLRRYLDDEQREVWASLTLGAGRVLEDLAKIYGHPLTPAQRVTLRKKSARLRKLMKQLVQPGQHAVLHAASRLQRQGGLSHDAPPTPDCPDPRNRVRSWIRWMLRVGVQRRPDKEA